MSSDLALAGSALAIVLTAPLLAFAPRRLLDEVGDTATAPAHVGLALAMAAVGMLVVALAPMRRPDDLALALALMAVAGVIYCDLRARLIADLHIVVIGAAAALLALPDTLIDATTGAIVGGGLLGGVRWMWRRATGIEGIGWGDVKLALVLGGLLGPERLLWVVSVSAALAAAGGLVVQATSRPRDLLIPYGAVLGGVAAALLVWSQ